MLTSSQILALAAGDVLVSDTLTVVISKIVAQRVSPTSGKAFIIFQDHELRSHVIREETVDAHRYSLQDKAIVPVKCFFRDSAGIPEELWFWFQGETCIKTLSVFRDNVADFVFSEFIPKLQAFLKTGKASARIRFLEVTWDIFREE